MNSHTTASHLVRPAIGVDVFNLAEALERVEGDTNLLQEMAELFLEEYPHMLVAIEAAIMAGDVHALQHAAHALKGSVSNFAAAKVTEACFSLEKMGRQQDLSNASSALTTLKQELAAFTPALGSFKPQETA